MSEQKEIAVGDSVEIVTGEHAGRQFVVRQIEHTAMFGVILNGTNFAGFQFRGILASNTKHTEKKVEK